MYIRQRSVSEVYNPIDVDKKLVPEEPKPISKCEITIEDTKQKFQLPILRGTDGSRFIDITKLHPISQHFTYDPGFSCTAYCCSQITFIDGEKGILQHRGYNIIDLANNCSYLEVCYLLIFGRLPAKQELRDFEDAVLDEMFVHGKIQDFYDSFEKDSHPMAIMVGIVGALSGFMKESEFIYNENQRLVTAIRVLSKMPFLAAMAYRTSRGLPIVYPKKKYGYIENFMRMMFKNPVAEWKIDRRIIELMEKIMILHADHEQNASTSTVRIACSSLANPYACIAAGIASLWGPSHGGANEAVITMLEEIGDPANIPSYIEKVRQKKFRLIGFGHRIYHNFDPRAVAMKDTAKIIAGLHGSPEDKKLLDLALKLEEAALKDPYFIEKKIFPNVDFYTGIIYRSIGIPKNMYTVMFAVSRSVGWITQLIEATSDKIKLCRPRQLFVGHLNREFVKLEDRKEAEFKVVLPGQCGHFKLPV